jgi:hypothetical protein
VYTDMHSCRVFGRLTCVQVAAEPVYLWCSGLGGHPYHEGWSELQGTFRLGLYIDIRA